MHTFYCNPSCCLLLCLLVTNFARAAIEGIKCQRTDRFDTELMVTAQDFGSKGVRGPFNVTIVNPLQIGAVVSAVTKSNTSGSFNLIFDDTYVFHLDARIQKNELIISSRLNNQWQAVVKLDNPVRKGVKATTTVIYEVEGFRIFIDGTEIAFYKHRTEKIPQIIHLAHDYVYKVMYMTTRESGKQVEVSIN